MERAVCSRVSPGPGSLPLAPIRRTFNLLGSQKKSFSLRVSNPLEKKTGLLNSLNSLW